MKISQKDNIEHVDDIGELQHMINSNDYLMAYFFHPNCYPCMDFVPQFDTLPDKVKELEWAKGVEFVKVNMGGHEDEIGAKYSVKGYPWINFYRKGKAIQFKGRRHVPKLITFMYQRIMQPFRKGFRQGKRRLKPFQKVHNFHPFSRRLERKQRFLSLQ